MFHTAQYERSPQLHFLDERLNDLHDYCNNHTRFRIDRLYGEAMINTAGPKRRRHLEQVMANDGHMGAQPSRQARQRMKRPAPG